MHTMHGEMEGNTHGATHVKSSEKRISRRRLVQVSRGMAMRKRWICSKRLAMATFSEIFSHIESKDPKWKEMIKTEGSSDLYQNSRLRAPAFRHGGESRAA
jgi:hypothetical protein